MTTLSERQGLTRRQLISRSFAASAGMIIGTGFIAAPDAAWAYEPAALRPESFATLVRMARDIYPHDRISDEYYVLAVKAWDTPEAAPAIEAGIATLNAAAEAAGFATYAAAGWEDDRVAILRGMENTAFFQQIRGGLVTGLYNQKAVWPLFGYEGESFSQGGYLSRGFDDISWL